MLPKKKNDKTILECVSCGYSLETSNVQTNLYRISRKITHTERERIVVVDESKLPRVLPVTKEVICPKCGYEEAYYWLMQTRRADEPPTRFFKCRRCGYVWREYA